MSSGVILNKAISASAGSGKTFQLAHRYLWLLAKGEKPGRICALTFSRKAAGEIFDSIVKYLSEAASSTDKARETGERIQEPGFDTGDFLGLLRELLASLHRLHIGTLDSFTVNIIRTFPMELGISMDLQVMDNEGAAADRARREVLLKIFDHRKVERPAQRRFLEAFKQATFGQEEKSLQRSLQTFTGKYHNYYQLLSERDAWGNEGVIWPDGSPWLTPVEDVKAAADELEDLLETSNLDDKVMKRWRTFLEAARGFGFGSPWSPEIKYLFDKLVAEVDNLRRGSAVISMDKKESALSDEKCRLALTLLTHIMQTGLRAALERTRGIYLVLDQYEKFYDDMIRRQGKLTFADTQYLLTEANRHSGGALISRASRLQARLYIDYRLDCKLDHWLLDEFQDTSDLQWEVFRNLIDEILQDASGTRSFFYVGDVKQAIYGWRGGNYRLFGNILKQYPDRIEESPLSTSFRSSQPIIDTVNQVFGSLPEDVISPGVLEEWNRAWQTHLCQEDFVPETGYAALFEPPCRGGEVKPTVEDRYGCVARLLKEVDPLSRDLSVAILVRSNKSGKAVVDYLRRECRGMTVVHEGKAIIKDNPVISVLLSLIKFAAHPGDTCAWRHLEMSPLRNYFAEAGLNRNNLAPKLLRKIEAGGFHPLVGEWGSRLEKVGALDDFGRKRLKDLVEAAIEFDGAGSRDCDAFLGFIDKYEIRELAAENAVRVMTIHQSKGLGFDIVVLPDLHGKSITGAGPIDFMTARDPGTTLPIWALKMPSKVIAKNDPVLASEIKVTAETACFEELCVLYVALTRAKKGLYLVTSFPGKGSTAVMADTLLKLQLAGDPKPIDGPRVTIGGEEYVRLYEAGDPDWYKKERKAEGTGRTAVLRELPEGYSARPSRRRRLTRVSPSARAREKQNAASLFEPAARASLDFGSAMHELFSKLSWIDEADIEGLINEWRGKSPAPEEVKQKVTTQFRQALAIDEVRQALSRPQGDVELWREKLFDIIIEDQWVTGAFDRVVITMDESGAPLCAVITDYKSDKIAGDDVLTASAERYRSQLELYGNAVSRLLQLPREKITLRLLFTQPGTVYDL